MGFNQVFRYTAGKADWLADGLPVEGKKIPGHSVRDLVWRDVPTCGLTDQITDVQNLIQRVGAEVCVVVNERRVVLGLVHREIIQSNSQSTIEEVMESGPTTFRPNRPCEDARHSLQKQGKDKVLITTSDGNLIGLLYLEDIERQTAGLRTSASAQE